MKPRHLLSLVTNALLLLILLAAAGFLHFAQAAPVANPSLSNIVISEFRTRGGAGLYDEFVELFNPSVDEIDISRWVIRISAGCSTTTYDLVTIPAFTSLSPGQHYLLASSEAAVDDPDHTWTSSTTLSIPDLGGIALFDPGEEDPVDSAGMCVDTLFKEGQFLLPLTEESDQSYERRPGGVSGNCTDSDDNRSNFILLSNADPQRSTSPFTTACNPSIPTLTFTATDTLLPAEQLVISEFRTRGTNGEKDEFVEIFNPTSSVVYMGGWQLWRSSGCGLVTTPLFTFPEDLRLPAGHHFLAAAVDSSLVVSPDLVYDGELPDTGGLALVNRSGAIIDQVGLCVSTRYLEGSYLEPLAGELNQAYERKPGGEQGACYDTADNGMDFALISPAYPENLESQAVFCSGMITLTPKFTPTYPGNATHVVISEFRSRGSLGDSDEFIELYNPSGAAVNMGGWTLKRSSGCGGTITSMATIPSGTLLLAGQHYLLLSNPGSSLAGADQVFSPGIEDKGGIALLNASNVIVDQVGMCSITTYREDHSLEAMSGVTNQSYERLPGGITSCQDTDDNQDDFRWNSISLPQNRLSPIVMCTGVKTYTPTVSPTKSRTPTRTQTNTRTPSKTPTVYPGNVVLNEYLPRPISDWNGDGEANTKDEYIEIINMGTREISIRNWKLDDADGGSSPYTLPSLVLAPLEIARFFASETGISLSDGGDTVRLIKPDGNTADIHYYSIVPLSNQTWCRLPDGTGAWAFVCRPTPARPNIRLEPGDSSSGGEGAGEESLCGLPGSIPQPFLWAECDSTGGSIARIPPDTELWIFGLFKWAVFIK